MEDYLIGLVFIAFLVAVSTVIQARGNRYRHLYKEYQLMQMNLQELQVELREKENDIDKLQKNSANLLKWKDRASELEIELRSVKGTLEYASAKKLENLERYVASIARKDHAALFLTTFQPEGQRTFEDKLVHMLAGAEFEVVIVSPWIKGQMWDRIKGPIGRFARKGGSLKVFMRGCESDFSYGLSDDIRRSVNDLGGEVILIKQLHAKLYMADRREAIIASANLTRGGIEGNYEAGIWVKDPFVMKEICKFVNNLYIRK